MQMTQTQAPIENAELQTTNEDPLSMGRLAVMTAMAAVAIDQGIINGMSDQRPCNMPLKSVTCKQYIESTITFTSWLDSC